MRTADYIFKSLADLGFKHCFMVSGGGAMHLDDALGRETRIKYICNHHEQACAMAAESYARIANKPGLALVTTGPGGTNAVTGVMGAWVDSIPMLVISGQVKLETTIKQAPGLRQLGDQEINIVDIVRPITKYAAMVEDKKDIAFHLEKALHLASSGRPGPVWIDVPLDIQGAEIDPAELRHFTPEPQAASKSLAADAAELLALVKSSKRPVIVAGNGVRLSGAAASFVTLAEKLNIPVLTAISGVDLIDSGHPLFFGRPGIIGERPANLAMQNSDLLIVIGSRMNLRVISYDYKNLARKAFKVGIDIDAKELEKPTIKYDKKIVSDAAALIDALLALLATPLPEKAEWLGYCRKVKAQYPVVQPKHRERDDYVSSYYFPEALSRHFTGNEIVACGNGTIYTSTFQALRVKKGVRFFANVGCASMGYCLPSAIGAAFANEKAKVVCLSGDGSVMMNLQELQTILNYKLPIIVFMANNKGYLSIKNTQKAFFKGHFVGSTPDSGIILPEMERIAAAFGFEYERIESNRQLDRRLPEIMAKKGPFFCELMYDPDEILEPKSASIQLPDGRIVSRPLEDLAPFVDREEFKANMLIEPLDCSK